MDLRGHGKSLKPKSYQEYEMDQFVHDLFLLTQSLQLRKFVLIGHSFGSLVVLAYLARYQDTVAAAVLLSPHFDVGRMRSARIIKTLLCVSSILKIFPFPKVRGHVDYERHKNTGDWNIRRMISDVRNTGLRVYLYCTKQSYQFDGEHILDKVHIPVLIMHGRRDTIFPVETAFVIANRIRGSRLIVLDDTNHIMVLNNEEELSDAIENFVQSWK